MESDESVLGFQMGSKNRLLEEGLQGLTTTSRSMYGHKWARYAVSLGVTLTFCSPNQSYDAAGHPPKLLPPAHQNSPGLIGLQKVRLVILFGPKVQGTPADVTGSERVVRGARSEECGAWSFVRCGRIGALYQHSLRVRISCAPPPPFAAGIATQNALIFCVVSEI